MGNGVLDALAEVLEGGKETVEALRAEGRIVAETWVSIKLNVRQRASNNEWLVLRKTLLFSFFIPDST